MEGNSVSYENVVVFSRLIDGDLLMSMMTTKFKVFNILKTAKKEKYCI